MYLNSSSPEVKSSYDWDSVVAYISAEPLPEEIRSDQSDIIREGYKTCAMSLSFQNHGFNADYLNLGGPRSYLGLE